LAEADASDLFKHQRKDKGLLSIVKGAVATTAAMLNFRERLTQDLGTFGVLRR
jgi:hypothetical protein